MTKGGTQVKRLITLIASGALVCSVIAIGAAQKASAWDLTATPFTFVGTAADCGTTDGSNIVTAAWLDGLGLPDNGGPNTSTTNPNPNTKQDPHQGLLLSKNGPTPDCSAAGATIDGVEGMPVPLTGGFRVGFDARNGGHCGGGAPRFNVTWWDPLGNEMSSFVGNCSLAIATPAGQDALQWTRYRWDITNPAQAFPPVTPGSTIKSIDVLFDEGTDQPGAQDPNGIGLATIDNILIDHEGLIRNGP
jgi:hypothetical protein